jgi:hypothetical protein
MYWIELVDGFVVALVLVGVITLVIISSRH